MNYKTLFRFIVVALLLGSTTAARAAIVGPTIPTVGGSIPAGYVNCTAEALNISGFVGSDGRVVIYNLPVVAGPVIAHVTCQDSGTGATVTGESPPFLPSPSMSVDFGTISFGNNAPTPSTLSVSPPLGRPVINTTEQLQVTANFPSGLDGGTGDLTAAATGTVYTTSNPAVATVSADGLVTAVGTGTAIIHATNDGSSGFATVTVLPYPLTQIIATPTSLGVSLNPLFPAAPIPLKVTGILGNHQGTIDLTTGSGLSYSSDHQNVADVTPDGVVVVSSACAYNPAAYAPGPLPPCPTISISDQASGLNTAVQVEVTQFVPYPIAQYALPGDINKTGFACNVDLDGTLAYVANGNGGFRVVDVSTTTSAGTVVGTYDYGQGVYPNDVSVRNPIAAVALGSAGVSILNVSHPAAPYEIWRFANLGNVQSVRLSGNQLYVGSMGGFFAYDLTYLLNPVGESNGPYTLTACEFGAYAVAGDATRNLAVVLDTGFYLDTVQLDSDGCHVLGSVELASGGDPLGIPPNVYSVALLGTSAYAALGNGDPMTGVGGVARVDVTNPVNPTLLTTVQTIGSGQNNGIEAKGVAVRSTPQGVLVAVGEDHSLNDVPLYDGMLANQFPLNICSSLSGCVFPYPAGCGGTGGPACNTPVEPDPNGVGVALGNGFGIQCGGSGGGVFQEKSTSFLQVFATAPVPPTTAPPVVWITSPTEGDSVAGNNVVVATALASSAAGIASVQIIAGAVVEPTTQASPYTASFVPPGAGTLTITAKVTDKLGQVAFSAPVNVDVTGVPAHSLTAGNFFTCDVIGPNNVQCWGDNSAGELGNLSTATQQTRPVPVLNPGSSASISARGDHACVQDLSGAVFCWGANNQGQLGDNSTVDRSQPTQVFANNMGNVTAIGLGDTHSCAVSNGNVWCWGSNSNGQLGVPVPDAGAPVSLVPVQVNGISNAVQVVGGQSHTCALLSTGQVMCWGYNGFGQLGDGNFTDTSSPTAVLLGAGPAVEISAGELHTCARLGGTTGGQVLCWGNNGNGQVGNNGPATANYNKPQTVSGISGATELHAGGYHNCARLTGSGNTAATLGPVQCWGYNALGQIGDGTNTDRFVPTTIGNMNAFQLGAGLYHSCALTQTGQTSQLQCWGNNDVGELGNGTTTNSNTPQTVTFSN